MTTPEIISRPDHWIREYLDDHQDRPEIFTGKVCPYCGEASEYMDSVKIYGTSYGMVYACIKCDARVGVHRDRPREALGRLANSSLRFWKRKAHDAFDPLWKHKQAKGFSKKEARGAAYKWLADRMGIPGELCHIGMFSQPLCLYVVQLCEPWNNRIGSG